MAAMEQRRTRGRATISTILSGVVATLVGLVAAPAMAQAGAALTDVPAPGSWQSTSLVGLAVTLSLWGLRESYQMRLRESQRFAEDLAKLGDARLAEEREHREAVERIYACRIEDRERLLAFYERTHQEDQALQQDLLRRLLPPTPGGAP